MSTRQDDQSTGHQHQELAYSSRMDTQPAHNPSRVQPSPADIICGRGIHVIYRQGNLNLHLMANKHRDQYLRSTRGQKTKIVNRVLGDIKRTGARFIRNVSDGNGAEEWQEVDEATASKKVSHALRLRTTNRSNRHNIAIAATGSQLHRQGGPNTQVLNQLPVGCKEVKETPVPSATNTKSARHRGIVNPDPADIICGRGLHISSQRGNHNLHLMGNAYREEYLMSRRSEKRKITKHVLDKIKSTGARFVRKVSGEQGAEQWEVVDDETAYNKVSHALRLRTTNETNHKNGNTFTTERKLTLHGDSSPGALNQPKITTVSISSNHPASLPVNLESPQPTTAMREHNPAVQPNASNTTAVLPFTLTTHNGPTAPSFSVARLWTAQLPVTQPTYEGLLRQQQYRNFLYAMMQQLAQQPHR